MESNKKVLTKIVSKRPKRVGRGYGSGKGGHTAGRGQKGQKTRTSVPVLFEGIKTRKSLSKRLPQLRGKLKFKPKSSPVLVTRSSLSKFPAGAKVTVDSLVKYGLVDKKEASLRGVKIVGAGKLPKKLDILVPMSRTAAKKKVEKTEDKTKSK